jgi:hypothetical protein
MIAVHAARCRSNQTSCNPLHTYCPRLTPKLACYGCSGFSFAAMSPPGGGGREQGGRAQPRGPPAAEPPLWVPSQARAAGSAGSLGATAGASALLTGTIHGAADAAALSKSGASRAGADLFSMVSLTQQSTSLAALLPASKVRVHEGHAPAVLAQGWHAMRGTHVLPAGLQGPPSGIGMLTTPCRRRSSSTQSRPAHGLARLRGNATHLLPATLRTDSG